MTSKGASIRGVRVLLVTAIVVALVGVGGPATGVPAPQSRGAAAPQEQNAQPLQVLGSGGPASVDWQPCGPDNPGYDCATVTVPLDYDRPRHGDTDLALARIPAEDIENRIGTVFVNPGGPGGSGVEFVLSGFGEFLAGQLEGRFDIVGFDPRGVGASDPLHCFDSEDALVAFLTSQPVFPFREDQYHPYFHAYSGLAQECLDNDQRVAWHMNTADVARDMDLLRHAVGDPKPTYLGFSYGSYLGNTYANLFPDHVRALAIDGVLNPRLWSSGRQIKSDRTATQEEFAEFLRLCDEARTECAFWTPEGSEERWDALSDAVRHDPLELPEGFVYTYDLLIADAVLAMYAPEVWDGDQGAAAYFDLLADLALTGDESAAEAAARLRTVLLESLTAGTNEEGAAYANGLDAYFGNHCADVQYPHKFEKWLAIGGYAREGSEFGPYWWWFNSGCANWPVNKDRYVGPWTADTSAPVLLVGNYFDGITDYDGAVATDRLLRNSRLLSYAGWGHTAYGRSQCVTDHVDAYLLTLSLPPKGEVCGANPNPFLPAVSRTSKEIPLVGLPSQWHTRADSVARGDWTGNPSP